MSERRLLILHHDEDRGREIFSYFHDSGYQVQRCLEYDEVTEALCQDRHKPELMILGTDKPERAFYELIDHVRELSDLPVIMLSEDEDIQSQLYAYSRGIDDYMIQSEPLPLLEAHARSVSTPLTPEIRRLRPPRAAPGCPSPRFAGDAPSHGIPLLAARAAVTLPIDADRLSMLRL